MLDVGSLNTLEITRKIEAGWYLAGDDGVEVFLPRQSAPPGLAEGEKLDVMIYLDGRGRPVATTRKPVAEVGQFAFMKVTDVGKHGAFLDWGIEKDLLLPAPEQLKPLKKGDHCAVWVILDPRNDKPIATCRVEYYARKETDELEVGEKTEIMVYATTSLGYKVLIDGGWHGLLYFEECLEELRYGDIREGYILKIREDGKIDVTMRARGKQARLEGMDLIISALHEAGGFLPFHDKTPPSVIKEQFGMSKKQFKNWIGGLYRQGKILIEKDGIRFTGDDKPSS